MSPRTEIAQSLVTALNNFDTEHLRSILSKASIEVRPASLKIPVLTGDGYADFAASLKPLFPSMNIKIKPSHEIIESNDAVVFHLSADGITTSGGTFTNEYIMMFWFDENNRIKKFIEFVDSKYATETVAREKELLSNSEPAVAME